MQDHTKHKEIIQKNGLKCSFFAKKISCSPSALSQYLSSGKGVGEGKIRILDNLLAVYDK